MVSRDGKGEQFQDVSHQMSEATKLMYVRLRTKGDASCVVWLRILRAPDIYMGSENKVKLSKME